MSTSEKPGLVTEMAQLSGHVGEHLGYTEWREMDQQRVNEFADVTDDHNFIHVDPEAAKRTPFGGTIAHGYLTLSLAAPVAMELLQVTDATVGLNYGSDRVRFPSPLPVGARVARRLRADLGRAGGRRPTGQGPGDGRGPGPGQAGDGRRHADSDLGLTAA